MKFRSLIFAGAAAAALAAPSGALAIDTNSTVSGTAGTELSLAVATPSAMTFTPSTDGTTSSLVTVTSTAPTWTLSILESGTGADGKMATAAGVALNNALEWKLSSADSYTALTGTAATVDTGVLVDTRTIAYKQQIDASEDITSGVAYSAVVTLRVVGS
jgi:hypothetical protein